MRSFRLLSAPEQVARRLREEILDGRLSGPMPGVHRLANEFGVHRKTAEKALRELERQGILAAQGAGRRRKIVPPMDGKVEHPLRIAILNHEPPALAVRYMAEMQHLLQEAGHAAFFAGKCLVELRMHAGRIARLVRKTEADAWVVVSASREVLGWFIEQGIPAFALFGRRRELPIAGGGPDKVRAYRAAVRRLAALGHRRIVLLTLPTRRLPEPGTSERAFLKEMAAQGIPTGPYNLPDWEESPEGIQGLLDSLFRVTAPTALLIDEAYLFHAVKHHLSQRGILAPEDVSLICTDPDRTFAWCRPSIAHFRWDSRPVVRRVVRWADNVALGRDDRRQSLTKAEFVEGGTMGPAPAGR